MAETVGWDSSWESTLAEAWPHICCKSLRSEVLVQPSAAEGMLCAEALAEDGSGRSVEVLVTGSLYLVGSVLSRVHNDSRTWANAPKRDSANENKWPAQQSNNK